MNHEQEPSNTKSTDKDLALAHLTGQQRHDLARAKSAALWVGLIIPLILTLAGTVITASWVSRMPDPMATHWGGNFEVDGYGPPWSNTAIALGTGLGVTSLYFLQSLNRMKPGVALWSAMHRFLPAMVLGTVAFLQFVAVSTAYIQLDLTDPNEASGTGLVVAGGFVGWILLALIAYFIQPKLIIAAPDPTVAEPLPLTPTERAVWFGEVRPSKPFVWLVLAVMVLLFCASIAIFLSGVDQIAGWIMLASSVLLLAITLSLTWFKVRIDSDGIEARAPLGWPVFKVAASDVKQVSAIQISPFAEYGGWGVRVSPTGFGIVMRDGEGILIERNSRSRSFAITVDDAATGAALLAAMADRAKHTKE